MQEFFVLVVAAVVVADVQGMQFGSLWLQLFQSNRKEVDSIGEMLVVMVLFLYKD